MSDFDQTIEALEQQKANLFDQHGQPRYSPTETAGTIERLSREATEAHRAHDQRLVQQIEEVRAQLATIQEETNREQDPLLSLSPQDLARANGLKIFIDQDFENLNLTPDHSGQIPGLKALADHIEAAIKDKDKALLALYLRALTHRKDPTPALSRGPKIGPLAQIGILEGKIREVLTPIDNRPKEEIKRLQIRWGELGKQRQAAQERLKQLTTGRRHLVNM